MPRKATQQFLLIECFARAWSEEYGGEVYEKSGKDFKHAQIYIDLNDGWNADNITAKAKIYLERGGFFSENRHNFTAFINNIGSWVDEKPKRKETKPVTRPLSEQLYFCDKCKVNHRADELCPKEIESASND